MIRLLIGFIVFIAMGIILVNGIGAFLGPDGLSHCDPYPSTKQDCESVDAIVAISGGDTSARTAQAIEMYKQSWAPLLVFSGAAADKTGPSNAEAMKRQALEAGVSASDILIDETSETTKQNALNSVGLFDQHHIRSVILVTSAYHQRRAGLEFGHRAGMSIKIVNHPLKNDKQWSDWWWATPSGWYLVVSEFVKIIAFYVGVGR
jgi:uncharacterized SAM-binding protein YcdF (DUF218 family)